MRYRLIRKDIIKNKAVTLTIVFFIAIAAMLLSLTSILSIHLFGSIDYLMQEAKTPHFIQMHSGGLDRAKLESFAQTTEGVEAFQVLSFLGINSEQIAVNGTSFTVAGFVRDSQMNSALAYSKRFVVNPADYTKLELFGAVEYFSFFISHCLQASA